MTKTRQDIYMALEAELMSLDPKNKDDPSKFRFVDEGMIDLDDTSIQWQSRRSKSHYLSAN